MIHSQVLTENQLAVLAGFQILKDDGIYQKDDYLMITVRNEKPADESGPEDRSLTRTQLFFLITDVQAGTLAKGVRRGYALVKFKRTKNPLPKKVDEVEALDDTEA